MVSRLSGGAVHELIAAPLLIVLCVAALIYVLGASALVGVATLIASLAFTSYLARRQSFLQDKIMHVSDRRVSAISELLTSIKLIKLYSWQLPFSNSISKIRAEQEGYLYRSTAIGAITRCLGLSSPLFRVVHVICHVLCAWVYTRRNDCIHCTAVVQSAEGGQHHASLLTVESLIS